MTHANLPVPHVIEPSPVTDHSTIRVSFTTRTAGKYTVDIMVNTRRINEGSICRNYLPGTNNVDCRLERESSESAAQIQTKDLLNASHMLITLSHWVHGIGAEYRLHMTALCGGLNQTPTDLTGLNPTSALLFPRVRGS